MSATKRDYYEVLGVARGATEDEVRRAYRRLARQFHPDVNKAADAEAKFKEINEAYEVLSDAGKRSAYDRFGHAGIEGGMGSGAYSPFGASPFADIFDFMASAVRSGSRAGPMQGADLVTQLNLTLEEIVFGVERELEISRLVQCATCGGSGAAPDTQVIRCTACNGTGEVRRIQNSILGQMVTVAPCTVCHGEGTVVTTPCPTCQGEGRVREISRLVVTVPAGLSEGQRIRLTGEGDAGPRGAPPGDLYIEFEVKPHKIFRRRGYDILLDLPLNVAQASLGVELQVPTLDGGHQELRVPPGTQHDKVFVLRGQGVPHLRGSGRGDQLVRVHVQIPTSLTDEQRRLLSELAQTFGEATPLPHEEKGFFGRIKDAFGG
jgi:molecular chaperone DnaJ